MLYTAEWGFNWDCGGGSSDHFLSMGEEFQRSMKLESNEFERTHYAMTSAQRQCYSARIFVFQDE